MNLKINILIFVSFFLLFSCANSQNTENISEIKDENIERFKKFDILITPNPQVSYKEICQKISQEKNKLKIKYQQKKIGLDSIQKYFTEIMVNQIFPYWYGTYWTFTGHTTIPKQGTIACGYFVSTTLLQAGININRYELAQQLPIHEAKTLQLNDSLYIFNSQTALKDSLKKDSYKEGLYFIGLDEGHVGFLLKRKKECFFIQSNYREPNDFVMIEKIEESAVFNSLGYQKFYLVPLSNNQQFIKNWLNNTNIAVVKN